MNYLDVLVEEVALEGLDGITLPTLWLRLKANKDFTFGLEDRCKAFLWRALISRQGLEFYELPKPRADVEPFNRFEHICEDDGFFTEPENLAPDPYPVEVIESEEVMGSCTTFQTRKNITASIRGEDGACLCTLQEAVDRWGRSLVVVASQSQRNLVLTGSPVRPMWIKTAVQYAALEGLGRSRYNGLMTGSASRLSFAIYMGSSNTKLSFLIIKTWVKLGIATKQSLYKKRDDGFCTVSMLVHLKRFHRAVINRTKEMGLQLCDYLRSQPNKRQIIGVICEELGLDKSLMKRARTFNKGRVKVETVPYRTMFPDALEEEYMRQATTIEKKFHVLTLSNDFEDNEDNSDDDDEEESSGNGAVAVVGDTAHYTWKYGESVNRQVYQFISATGGTGVTFRDILQKMGTASARVRRVLKQLTQCGLLEPLRVSKDRLRLTVYVAKQFVASSDYKNNLDTQKKEFQAKTTETLANVTMEGDTTVDEEEETSVTQATSNSDSSFIASPVKTLAKTTSLVKTPATSQAPSISEVFSSSVTLTPASRANLDPRVEATLADITATFLPDVVEDCLPDINLKTMQRANVLLDLVKKQRVIDTYFSVKQGMQKLLDERGENEDGKMICIKTVRRLVNLCHAEGKIKKLVVKLESSKKTFKVVLICAKDVPQDDSTIQNIIQSSKIRHFCGYLPPPAAPLTPALVRMPRSICESIIEWDHLAKPSADADTSTAVDSSPPKEQKGPAPYASLPKMRRAALLHKFLWYLIYGYEGTTPSGCDQAKPADQSEEGETGPGVDGDKRAPAVYLDTWDWRRYLAPLRKHDDALEMVGRTQGTCLLGDLFMVMPLAIFCQCLHTTAGAHETSC